VWSNWAALAVTVLVLAGTAQALIEVVTVTALLHTTYGVLLLFKVGLLAVVLAVAALSRRAVQRRVAGKQPGVRGLRRTVLLEIAGAVVILGLASVLVQTTPARTASAAASGGADSDTYAVTLTSQLYQLQLDIEPIRVGHNWVHLYAFTPQGVTLTVKEWKASAALPAQGIEPIDVSLIRETDSHASGSVTLLTAGTWKFSFTLRISEFDEATVSTEVPIR
jgi:copper transport protein